MNRCSEKERLLNLFPNPSLNLPLPKGAFQTSKFKAVSLYSLLFVKQNKSHLSELFFQFPAEPIPFFLSPFLPLRCRRLFMLDEMVRGKLESRSRIAALSLSPSLPDKQQEQERQRASERVTLPREYGACSDVRQQIERNLRRDSASLDRPRVRDRSRALRAVPRCPNFLDTVLILSFSDLILIRYPPSLEESYEITAGKERYFS